MNRRGKEKYRRGWTVGLCLIHCKEDVLFSDDILETILTILKDYSETICHYKSSLMTKLYYSCIKQLRSHLMDKLKHKGRDNFLRNFSFMICMYTFMMR